MVYYSVVTYRFHYGVNASSATIHWRFGDVGAQVRLQRDGVGGRRHVIAGDLLHLVDGIRDDVQLTLQTGDLLIGERDTGEIAQVLDFFTCECRHGLNYMSRM